MYVMTATGPIAPAELGLTSAHEHLWADISAWLSEPATEAERRIFEAPLTAGLIGALRRNHNINRENYDFTDLAAVVGDLVRFREHGGGSIVELTSHGLSPDPAAVRRASVESGVPIVVGCGYYVANSRTTDLAEATVDGLHERLLAEIENGVAGTDVRPGIIGEIGTSESILPTEERALRAAARAHRDTGLAISVHTYGFAPQALEALDILEAEGANLERVAIGHLDHGPMDIELHKAIAARGAFVEYDGFGKDGWYMDPLSSWLPHDTDRLAAVVAMLSAGFIDRLLLACDVYSRMQLTSYGGWGYEHLPRHVAPALRHLGVSTGEVERILVENPRRLLTIPNES